MSDLELRDQLAAAALPGVINSHWALNAIGSKTMAEMSARDVGPVARMAYLIADAMLQERQGAKPNS